jgi:hypothetical protein
LLRDLSVIQAFAAQLGISFNPSLGRAFERMDAIEPAKSEITGLLRVALGARSIAQGEGTTRRSARNGGEISTGTGPSWLTTIRSCRFHRERLQKVAITNDLQKNGVLFLSLSYGGRSELSLE